MNNIEKCVGPTSKKAGKVESCKNCPNLRDCQTGTFHKQAKYVQKCLTNIKNIFMVVSGKGGVGKSTVSAQLAWALSLCGHKVGILDVDICGPSIPRLMGKEKAQVHRNAQGWEPITINDNLVVMSASYLLDDPETALIWRGPRITSLITQFLQEVIWGELDFLIIDTPPGTSDVHISLGQNLSLCNVQAVLVTTPQEVAIRDVRKCVKFLLTAMIKIKGVVENMSYFICPCCQEHTDIFSLTNEGIDKLCKKANTQMLGRIPIDPLLGDCAEKGLAFPFGKKTPVSNAFKTILASILGYEPRFQYKEEEDSF